MASKLSQESRKIGELLFIVGLAALLLLLGVVATRGLPGGDSSGTGSTGGDPQPSPTSAIPSPTPVPGSKSDPESTRDPRDTWVPAEQFPGVPAIQPSLNTAAPGEPRITLSDIEAYVARGSFDAYGAEGIVSIEFLPAAVVEQRFNKGPGAYGGRLLCVVVIEGNFSIRVPRELAEELRKAGKKPEAFRKRLILDALTGNLLTTSYPS